MSKINKMVSIIILFTFLLTVSACGNKKYTVIFETDGGTEVDDQKITKNNLVTIPTPDPEKEGYIFDGWYEDVEKTALFQFDLRKVTNDIVIYAKWKEDGYKKLLNYAKKNFDIGTDFMGRYYGIEVFPKNFLTEYHYVKFYENGTILSMIQVDYNDADNTKTTWFYFVETKYGDIYNVKLTAIENEYEFISTTDKLTSDFKTTYLYKGLFFDYKIEEFDVALDNIKSILSTAMVSLE